MSDDTNRFSQLTQIKKLINSAAGLVGIFTKFTLAKRNTKKSCQERMTIMIVSLLLFESFLGSMRLANTNHCLQPLLHYL
jgi:hypothetical protein